MGEETRAAERCMGETYWRLIGEGSRNVAEERLSLSGQRSVAWDRTLRSLAGPLGGGVGGELGVVGGRWEACKCDWDLFGG